mmetsp:Transcript_34308/g.109288  ORF Transcript_34308/g.109288 Transcript_34308/m.109288 type:complete len:166 (+) Transcript_34308:1168-1665(+)
MYAAQLHWLRMHFSSSQILTCTPPSPLTAQTSTRSRSSTTCTLQPPPTCTMASSTPTPPPPPTAHSTNMIECSTHAQLPAIFEPHNEPCTRMEREFDRFPPASDVPCGGGGEGLSADCSHKSSCLLLAAAVACCLLQQVRMRRCSRAHTQVLDKTYVTKAEMWAL